MNVRILGCGTSSGVPRIGNNWGDCDPAEPRNRRLRSSILVSSATTRLLVDTGPDMRAQLLAADVDDVDAVLWTHDHADHCHGIDDLRQLYHKRGAPVRAYARAQALAALKQRFAYAFDGRGPYPPTVDAAPLPDRLAIGDIDVAVVDQPHGDITSAGFVFTNAGRKIGYSTDFNALTADMIAAFSGVDLWIVDALRHRPHPTHPHLSQVLAWIEQLRPRHTVLVHMDESMDYRALAAMLPPGVVPGYDGLELAI